MPDWLSYNYDRERTGWNRGETDALAQDRGQDKAPVEHPATTASRALVLSTLTAPVVAAGVSTPDGTKDLVFSIGIDDVLSAVDASTGKIVWQKSFPNTLKPLQATLDQLLQYRAGDARDRQGAGRDLLHHQ